MHIFINWYSLQYYVFVSLFIAILFFFSYFLWITRFKMPHVARELSSLLAENALKRAKVSAKSGLNSV